ncbi:hypothetical protein [Stenotrophomonas pavanii]|uniref:hypothetical protein n=1 Tax=Stenotrophomonas pavanii TaxID=487698 RepID=UPI00383A5157
MRLIVSLLAALLPCAALAAPSQVVTDDIARFWATYDAVRAEPDAERRVALVQQRYIDPGSPGLHALMQVRHYTAREYAEAMQSWPRFWTSVRPLTANAQQASATLERDLAAFRALYPALRPATITYAVGVLRTGGTTLGDKVLIGAEMALGDEREGVAEYVAERISGRRPALPLYTYGPAHEAEIRARFLAEMHGDNLDNWLYNSARNPFGVSDLGYYAGYRIAQEYMRRQADETAGIARMIELDYADPKAVADFIEASGWLQAR